MKSWEPQGFDACKQGQRTGSVLAPDHYLLAMIMKRPATTASEAEVEAEVRAGAVYFKLALGYPQVDILSVVASNSQRSHSTCLLVMWETTT